MTVNIGSSNKFSVWPFPKTVPIECVQENCYNNKIIVAI